MIKGINTVLRSVVLGAALLLFAITLAAAPTLTWDANTEDDLGGYKVYIADASTTFSPVNLSLQHIHTLTNLDAETTYWVYVTAYNTNGVESIPSTVLQFPPSASCNYSIHPAQAFAEPWGSTGSFRVTTTSDCAWTATSQSEWIKITSAASGAGMVNVQYEVARNTSSSSRVGSITVASQTFYVNQSGGSSVPVITSDLPGAVFALEGNTVNLSVEATATTEIRYQWFRDGLALAGATNSSLQIVSAGPEDEGQYTVEVSSPVLTLSAGPTRVNVYARPRIRSSAQPQSVGVVAGGSASLFVGATGPDLRYEWSKDGVVLPVNSPLLTIPSVTPADLGSYAVEVSNILGTVVSQRALVFYTTPVQLAGQIEVDAPVAGTVNVEANGISGETYQVEASMDLIDWFAIDVRKADSTGHFTIAVPAPSVIDRWFVRTVRRSPVTQ